MAFRTTAAAMALAFAPALAQAEDFRLDDRFTDADGDMVADAPADPAQLLDPDTLVFAYTPVEDPSVYVEVWSEFVAHLAEATGKEVQYFPVQSYAAQQEALRAGRVHIAAVNAGGVATAVACAGFVPFAIATSLEGAYGYEMEIITHPDAGIASVEDIRGRTLAFTTETSNSGFKAPSALLAREFGMAAGEDFTPAFSGAHDNSVLGVVNKDYDAAAVANSVSKRMVARGVVNEGDFVTVYTSETFPTSGFGHLYNLDPALAETIRDAFFSFDWTGTKLLAEFENTDPPQQKFSPVSFKDDWAILRAIDAELGVAPECLTN